MMMSLRVVRSNSLTDRAFSNRVMSLLSAEGVTFNFRAAAVKLPSFTTKINEAKSGSSAINFWFSIYLCLSFTNVFP
ncbi:protein of unknown function [Vibrio tapetis subsp. tapetis]|uniref:Uncharacterized protein n=1 Tax=Vibrio tapetis subsp. tapetis TaxID=1671868 RepID=A0A2N8ZMU1_9VIBR|nr:protein of unknown function [Vibrio tapetis subsp. tapetis]